MDTEDRGIRSILSPRRLRIGFAAMALAVGASAACGGAPAKSAERQGKLAPEIADWLRQAAPGARIGVVADFTNRPRPNDLLALGLSDCLADPALSNGYDSQLSFDAYDLRHPAPAFGEMCVGHPTREALLRLIDNGSVTSIDAWNDR